jgi:sortase (surface protein transpeptidase)
MKQTRRQLLGSILAGITVAGGVATGVRAGSGSQLPTWGENAPANLKAGPLGLNPVPDEGEIPVAIRIPDADVDAEVERNKIVGGQMLDPSGPWVVAWYEGTGLAGSRGNAVMSGHVDYWDVGPAVFRNVANLVQGSEVQVAGADGTIYTYSIEYIERVRVADLTQEKINEIVNRTDYAALTLITCGGEFNYDAGEYYERDIIRARLTGSSEDANAITAGAQQPAADEPASGGTPATISGEAVNLRSSASTSADIVEVLSSGQAVTITGAPTEADGYAWLPVRLEDGTEGWVVQDFVQTAG